MPYRKYLSPIEEVLEDARNGRMFILVDEEDRENEGDLVIPAEMAGPEEVNFMARFGRGLICLSLTSDRVNELELPLMNRDNQSRFQTAFTVSIEAAEGVTTGISAADRATTIAAAIDPKNGAEDIRTPGHVFPLIARNGGVLVRAGHTEAAVDVARLAGLIPAGVICEIMNDDGTMARLPELVEFAKVHGLKVATIADLIAYRMGHDRLIKKSVDAPMKSGLGGDFTMHVYNNEVEEVEYAAFVKGDITTDAPVLVRMHSWNVFEDVLRGCDGTDQTALDSAIQQIGEDGRGVIIVIREHHPEWVSRQVDKKQGRLKSEETDLRHYGIGAQILVDLGVREMILLSNHKRNIVGLEGYGLRVVGQKALNDRY
ncbi:MAG TPA: 3,4-dihydroxy-2-butanone-4-phosphate synthase [Sneathiellales bacterium]|nr:3,4-dihydroxy-2-butanone-4-phosphate synthase [Sneathiellales bacterium]